MLPIAQITNAIRVVVKLSAHASSIVPTVATTHTTAVASINSPYQAAFTEVVTRLRERRYSEIVCSPHRDTEGKTDDSLIPLLLLFYGNRVLMGKWP